MTVRYDFSSKTAVVTGTAKGIGRRTAERLRDAGVQVWTWEIAPRDIDGVHSCSVDVRDRDQVATALNHVLEQSGGIDILVNSVGLLGGFRRFEEHTSEDFHRIVGSRGSGRASQLAAGSSGSSAASAYSIRRSSEICPSRPKHSTTIWDAAI